MMMTETHQSDPTQSPRISANQMNKQDVDTMAPIYQPQFLQPPVRQTGRLVHLRDRL